MTILYHQIEIECHISCLKVTHPTGCFNTKGRLSLQVRGLNPTFSKERPCISLHYYVRYAPNKCSCFSVSIAEPA